MVSETAKLQADLKETTAKLAKAQANLKTQEREEERYQRKDVMVSLSNKIRELQNIKQTLEEKIAAKEKEQAEVEKEEDLFKADFEEQLSGN